MDSDLERVGQAIRDRRIELGMTIKEAGLRGGVSDTTWGVAEAGRPVSRRSQVGICRALSWTSESFERVARGGEPEELFYAPTTTDGHQAEPDNAPAPSVQPDLRSISLQLIGIRADLQVIKQRLDDAGTIDVADIDPFEYMDKMIEAYGIEGTSATLDELRVALDSLREQRRLRLAAKGGNLRGAGRVVSRPQPPIEDEETP